MGLDMTLVKFVKVAGLEAKDYGKAANRIMPKTESGGIAFVDFEAEGFLAGSNALNISSSFLEGDSRFPMLGIQVGYWRKANAIHKWFVEHVRPIRPEPPMLAGVDLCEQAFLFLAGAPAVLPRGPVGPWAGDACGFENASDGLGTQVKVKALGS
jgi:hypothetical protein